jgi:lactate dehydrogenase-like 2-hydroxyacid dehydrogenase
VRILVASTAFPDAERELRARLPDDEIVVGIDTVSDACEVIIPLMAPIEGPLMDRVRPQLIHQFGVGLEGVDRGAARDRGITVANVPAAGTGNSEGVGEIAVLHLLALLRRYRDAGQLTAKSQQSLGDAARRPGRCARPRRRRTGGRRATVGIWL